MQFDTEVLIVGAGPTGLMLAAQLLRMGISFRIIDKNADRAHESRAFAIQAKSMEIFQNLGIVNEFLKKVQHDLPINFYINGKHKLQLKLVQLNITGTPYPSIYLLPQSETENILAKHIEKNGIKIERQMSLESFTQTENQVNIILKNEITAETENLSCHYIVGCDGAHSMVRKILKISFKGGAYKQSFFLADTKVDFPDLENPGFTFFYDRKGILLNIPVQGDWGRLMGSKTKNFSASSQEQPTLEDITRFSQEVTHQQINITNPKWMTRFNLHHRVVNQYQKGRAFLAGDAAHIHSPVGGQGMNTGLQDATNLAWKIAFVLKFKSSVDLLTTYQTERLYIGKKLLKTTDRFFWFLTASNKLLIVLRPILLSIGMGIISKSNRIQNRLFWLMSQLGIHYPQNKFIYEKHEKVDSKFLNGPQAGYRAPDAPLGDSSLFNLFTKTPCSILLFQSPNKELTANEEEIIQKVASFQPDILKIHRIDTTSENNITLTRYGINETGIYFIRPDGYIGFRCSDLNLDDLVEYLKGLFGDLNID